MAAASQSRANFAPHILMLAVFTLAAVLPQSTYAQTSKPGSQTPCTTKPCPVSPSTAKPGDPQDASPPTTSQQFPYPGEKTSPDPQPPASQVPDTPNPNQPSSQTNSPSPEASPAQSFPYPGEKPASSDAPPNKQFPYPGDSSSPASSGSGSSSSSSSSSVDPDMPTDPDSDTPAGNFPQRRKLPKVKNLQSDDDREAEDITVARFYASRDNWNGAYLRGKDAVKHKPDDPDAHLVLAEAAARLNKKDEAVAEYKSILTLDSSESQIKAAHKALEHLQ